MLEYSLQDHRITECFELERTINIIQFQPLYHGQECHMLDHVVQSPIQPALEHLRNFFIRSCEFSGFRLTCRTNTALLMFLFSISPSSFLQTSLLSPNFLLKHFSLQSLSLSWSLVSLKSKVFFTTPVVLIKVIRKYYSSTANPTDTN